MLIKHGGGVGEPHRRSGCFRKEKSLLPFTEIELRVLRFVHLHPCIITQINPAMCTIRFNIFIYFSSLYVSGIHVPIFRRKLLLSMCHWYLSHSMGGVWSPGWSFHSTQQTRRHPYGVTSTSDTWIQ